MSFKFDYPRVTQQLLEMDSLQSDTLNNSQNLFQSLISSPTTADQIIHRQNYEILILGIGVLIFGILLFFLNIQTAKLKRSNRKLDENNLQLEEKRLLLQDQKLILHKQNKKLKKVNEELKEKERVKSAIIQVVAHDLKSPLNNIKGLSELIPLQGELGNEQRKSMDLINEIVEDSSEMIKRMLDLNAIETGNLVSKKEEFDLITALNQVVKQFQPTADAKFIHILRSYRGQLLIHSDLTLFKQALSL